MAQEKETVEKEAEYTQFRILRTKHCWIIQGFKPSRIASRGKTAGKPTEAKWIELTSFVRLTMAAQRLFELQIGQEVRTDGWSGQDLSQAMEEAMSKIETIVRNAQKEEEEEEEAATETSSAS